MGRADAERANADMQRIRAENTVAIVAKTEHGLVIDVNKYLDPIIIYGTPINKAQVPLVGSILHVMLKTATLLAKSGETSAAVRHDQGEALLAIAELLRRLRNSASALEAARQSRDIFKALVAADPGNTVDQRQLAVSYERIGAVLRVQQHPDQALAAYRRDAEIAERRHEFASPTRAKASAWSRSRPRRAVAITTPSSPLRCADLEPNPARCRRARPELSLPATDRGPAAGPLRRFLAHIFGIRS
jgi:tetratricopeptide (TPR) repeat protein